MIYKNQMHNPSIPSFDRLVDYHTLLKAWKIVSSKGSAGGVDGISIQEFEKDLGSHIGDLRKKLKEKKWLPQPYLSIKISKKDGNKRKLGLLTIKDKIVQQAIKQLVEPRFEKTFSSSVYAYRVGKGHTKAVRRAKSICVEKAVTHILKLDIQNFFDTIDHAILFKRIEPIVIDLELVRLIELCIKMGMVDSKMKWEEITKGVPQGAILSPCISNHYLVPFDQFVLTRTTRYVRYADDFIIGCCSEEEANKLLKEITSFLSDRLKLSLNEPVLAKVEDGVDFLGLHIDNKGFNLSPEKENDLKERIEALNWDKDNFGKSGLEKLAGIQRYYVPLLDPELLSQLDKTLIARLEKIVTTDFHKISGREVLLNALNEIPFAADENILRSKSIRLRIVELYENTKREAKKASDNTLTKKAIAQRKREYRALENQSSELIVNTPGSFIGISNVGITLKLYGKAQKMPPTVNLSHITVTADGVSISSNAIRYCMDHGIGIDFFDNKGHHAGGIFNHTYMQSAHWVAQATMEDSKRMKLAKIIITGKLKNQLNLVKYFHKYHKNSSEAISNVYEDVTSKISSLIDSLKKVGLSKETPYASVIIAIEAQGALAYWKYVRHMLSDDNVGFDSRVRQGATDLVNCMLNYGYAILYSQVWRAILRNKLNPYDSVLHVSQSGKPTFAFDVMELFRSQAVDRVVFSLIQRGEKLEVKKGILDDDTRKTVAAHVLERINRYERFRGKETKLCDIINVQCKAIAEFIVSDKTFLPYIAKW